MGYRGVATFNGVPDVPAVEEYADIGSRRHFEGPQDQFHEGWAVIDHKGKAVSIEAGVGIGLTSRSDTLTFKLMVSRDLNRHR